MPVFARNVLDVGSQGFGFLQSVGGAGALIGVLAVAWFSHSRGKGLQSLFGAIAFGILLMSFALSKSYPLSLILAFALGVTSQFYMTTISTVLQVNLPNERRHCGIRRRACRGRLRRLHGHGHGAARDDFLSEHSSLGALARAVLGKLHGGEKGPEKTRRAAQTAQARRPLHRASGDRASERRPRRRRR
jgi:hypothetical protein